MTNRKIALACCIFLVAQAAFAAVQYEFRQTRHSEVKGIPSMDIAGTAVIDGNWSRVDFRGGTGGYPAGTFVISDGARAVTVADPKTKRYSEVNLTEMASAIGSSRISVSNLKTGIEKLSDHPTVAGFATEHARITLTYQVAETFGSITLRQDVQTMIDTWNTSAFGDVKDRFLSGGTMHTGNTAIDTIIDTESTKVKGLALREVIQVTTTNVTPRLAKSELQITDSRRQVTEITVISIHSTAVLPSIFQIPSGYQKSDAPNRPEEMPIRTLTLDPVIK